MKCPSRGPESDMLFCNKKMILHIRGALLSAKFLPFAKMLFPWTGKVTIMQPIATLCSFHHHKLSLHWLTKYIGFVQSALTFHHPAPRSAFEQEFCFIMSSGIKLLILSRVVSTTARICSSTFDRFTLFRHVLQKPHSGDLLYDVLPARMLMGLIRFCT